MGPTDAAGQAADADRRSIVRRCVLLGALLVAAASLAILGRLDATVSAMHVAGRPAYGVSDLIPYADRTSTNGEHAVETWRLYDCSVGSRVSGCERQLQPDNRSDAFSRRAQDAVVHYHRAASIARAYVVVDGFFIVSYAIILGLWCWWLWTALEGAAAHTRQRALRSIVGIAGVLTVVLVAADVVEDVFQCLLISGGRQHSEYWIAAVVKLLAAVVVLSSLVVATVGVWMENRQGVVNAREALAIVRAQLLAVALFALGLIGPGPLSVLADQSTDVLRGWVDGVSVPVAGTVCTVWLSFTVLITGRWLLASDRDRDRISGRPLQLGFAAGGGAAGLVLLVAGVMGGNRAAAALGLVAGLVALFTLPAQGLEAGDLVHVGRERSRVPMLLAAVPPLALGVALMRAEVADIAYTGHAGLLPYAIVALGVAFQAAGWVMVGLAHPAADETAGRWWRILGPAWCLGTLAAVLFVAYRISQNPWRIGEFVGTIAIVALFLTALASALTLLVYASERLDPPGAFIVLGFRRTPVLALVVLVAVAGASAGNGGYHRVRLLGDAAADTDVAPIDAFNRWADAAAKTTGDSEHAIPMVFVAASGGGIKAAYWTSLVLSCVFEARSDIRACSGFSSAGSRERSFFAGSGASGGSVGLAEYAAAQTLGTNAPADWVTRRLGGDYVSPTVAWGLFFDLPHALFGLPDEGKDRAVVLDQAWRRAWVDSRESGVQSLVWGTGSAVNRRSNRRPLARGLLTTFQAPGSADTEPLLLLNGTSVQDGCRFAASPLTEPRSAGPQGAASDGDTLEPDRCVALQTLASRGTAAFGITKYLRSYLCPGQDVRLSTAGLLSARFPYVSPSGRLAAGCSGPGTESQPAYVVDGGYFDNSGGSAVSDLYDALQPEIAERNARAAASGGPCIVPMFVYIDSHYFLPTGPRPDTPPPEGTVPLATLAAAHGAHDTAGAQQAALAFLRDRVPGGEVATTSSADDPLQRFVVFAPRGHPGSEAPLGWSLSSVAKDDLLTQLALSGSQLETISHWFDPNLKCEAPPAQPAQ